MLFKMIARKMLSQFSKRYDYDVSYMRHMLSVAPDAFFKFVKLGAAASHHASVPRDAYYTVKLVGAVAEDCGPCVQLVVNMALEAGVERAQLIAVLSREPHLMNSDTLLGYDFADAIIRRSNDLDEVREVVRDKWGDAAIVDLILGMQVGRLYPMVKQALGYGKVCRRVEIDATPVAVIKEAA